MLKTANSFKLILPLLSSRRATVALALLALLSTINSPLSTVLAQGTAFTYQGRLVSGANAANGIYDLRFAICDAATNGDLVSSLLTNTATPVTAGLFTVNLDFGADIFAENARWLEIAVRTNGSDPFTVLAPRQPITPAPYAIRAGAASTLLGTVSAAQVTGTIQAKQLSGTLTLDQLPAEIVANSRTASKATSSATAVANVTAPSGNSYGISNWPDLFLASSPSVGGGPNCVVAMDVNGDGKLDLISANESDGTLTILTNRGYGLFGSNATLNVGQGPRWVAAVTNLNGSGYLNGSGLKALISANSGDDTLTVLTNNGHGRFSLSTTLPVGLSPFCVIAADVNGDGKPDLVSANGGDGTLTVLTNNVRGQFGSNSTLSVGGPTFWEPKPTSIVAADVNGDGKVDLVCAIDGGTLVAGAPGNLILLTNNGHGKFSSYVTLPVGVVPTSVAVVTNLDGHGLRGLVAAHYADSTLTVLTNSGHSPFGLAATLNMPNGCYSVTAKDVDGDGKPDLISASREGSSLTVLTNNGLGAFQLNAVFSVGFWPACAIAADLNGDGKLDLVTANREDNTLSVLLSGHYSTVGGGYNNTASAPVSTVGGGCGNTASAVEATVAGGSGNTASGQDSTVGGGNNNIAGGLEGDYSTVGGGWRNTASGWAAMVGGGVENVASGDSAMVGGGQWNAATESLSTVAGGSGNTANAMYAAVVGGADNTASGWGAMVGGGAWNVASGSEATVGGGAQNYATNYYTTVSGGITNTASGYEATVGGGAGNTASDPNATIAGGQCNTASLGANPSWFAGWEAIGGGYGNTANGFGATVPGGMHNRANAFSFAAGDMAQATNMGCFVWSDGTGTTTTSFSNNQFMARASGGVVFLSGTQASPTSYSGGTAGVALQPNRTAWSTVCDRNAKKDFAPVDCQSVLEKLAKVPIEQWHYKWEDASDVPNIGPIAQDFKAAFYPGRDDKSISTLELDGVELAAIQGLNQKLNEKLSEKEAELQRLQRRNDLLAERLSELEAAVKELATHK